ncbi:MAG: hypothetical protein K9M49_06425 [Candidatus Marinimicrobia bacterium]|nr:hypothetical protein [Candidatus Neomarinimicrobiota bacterium]MCF7851304.1 hypothetical protein [Candidatus Neomarinimicrobiota bacterium]MCF7904772.1 hypothetical protein [Candidatus Neomarinimicrobiota bacterium]
MRTIKPSYFLSGLCLLLILSVQPLTAQMDSTVVGGDFDSELLRLNVPDAFQKNRLRLDIYSDSSWVLIRGETEVSFTDALDLLGEGPRIRELASHLEQEEAFNREYRSRRVFASVAALVSGTYLFLVWDKDWVYQIPGHALLIVAGVRYWESHKAEIEALRQRYYIEHIMTASEAQKRVDAYNLKLYQFLSNTEMQYRDL